MQPKSDSRAERRRLQSPSEFKSGDIEGVIVRRLDKYHDERGWLAELFRDDELPGEEFRPAMAYTSTTKPGVRRGPHEHAEQAVQLPDRDGVFRRDLAAHLRDDVRLDAQRRGEVAHVVLALRHYTRDQQRLHPAPTQACFEPGHVLRRAADVEPRDDANNFHKAVVSSQ